MKEAMFWEPLGDGRAKCLTCPNYCVRGEGQAGRCSTRYNKSGKYYTLTYGKPCLIQEDPIAKNPLYHMEPGSKAIGVATAGCNLTCKYCQNWEISQVGPWKTRNMDVSPESLIQKVKDRGLKWITFSYTEPVVYLEYAIDTAKLAKKSGIKIAICSDGYICTDPLKELINNIDAFSVTFKGYTEEFYQDVCGCGMSSVIKTITAIAASGKWMEVVNLIVPGLNDEEQGIKFIAKTVVALNKNIPLHFLRFAPAYKLQNLAPTPVGTLEKARSIALNEGLKFVYVDLSGHEGANTYCPRCKNLLIERSAFAVVQNNLKVGLKGDGRCPKCSYVIPGNFVVRT